MLNCQNVWTFKKMLYCPFLFLLLNVRPGSASKFFQYLDKNLISLRVTTDGDLEADTHKYPLTTHFTLLDQLMGSLGFQHTETVCRRLQIECHPCRLIFPFPPPLHFLSFPQFKRKRACSQAMSI